MPRGGDRATRRAWRKWSWGVAFIASAAILTPSSAGMESRLRVDSHSGRQPATYVPLPALVPAVAARHRRGCRRLRSMPSRGEATQQSTLQRAPSRNLFHAHPRAADVLVVVGPGQRKHARAVAEDLRGNARIPNGFWLWVPARLAAAFLARVRCRREVCSRSCRWIWKCQATRLLRCGPARLAYGHREKGAHSVSGGRICEERMNALNWIRGIAAIILRSLRLWTFFSAP